MPDLAALMAAQPQARTAISSLLAAQQPQGAEPPDFTAQYNTQLTPQEEQQFQAWLQQVSQLAGRDVSKDLFDYDMRGAFKAGIKPDADMHWPDDWKKPNEPTFSTGSIYSGQGGYVGGVWEGETFTASPTNMKFFSPQNLQRVFQQEQRPGSRLILPGGR